MNCNSIAYSGHAVRRMFERAPTEPDILQVIENGEVIEDYPHDAPFPSALVLGWAGSTPIHVVVAREAGSGRYIVVTVYVPNTARWSPDCRTRI